jgi:multimeric flavodoxin WrbA
MTIYSSHFIEELTNRAFTRFVYRRLFSGGLRMKVVAFNGSPRKDGNTSTLIRHIMTELERQDVETEMIHLRGPIQGCIACLKCFENKDCKCILEEDVVNICIKKMIEADGIILGSPTYFADLTPELKSLIDRAGFVGKANGDMFKHKVGAAVVAVRRAGAVHVFDSINHFFLISQMIIPGSKIIGTWVWAWKKKTLKRIKKDCKP